MMTTIWYYKNVRFDGGVRTGLDVNDERVFQEFQPGPNPKTPACNGSLKCNAKATPCPVNRMRRDGSYNMETSFNLSLEKVAERLAVGIDELSMPFVESWTDPDYK